jgi:hypothetical protein
MLGIVFCVLWTAAWGWRALTRTARSLVSRSSRAAEPELLEVSAEKARQRALELLLAWLSPSQREQFLREARFLAVGSTSGKSYTVNTAAAYNVLDEEGWQFCTLLPILIGFNDIIEDRMLAQKICIESDEDDWLKTANSVRVPLWNTLSGTAPTPPPPTDNPETD